MSFRSTYNSQEDFFLKTIAYYFSNKNIISFLIFYTPFTLGSIPVNYLYVTCFFIPFLILINFNDVISHKRLLKTNYTIPILLFAISFFISMAFGLEYKNMEGFTDYDSSFSGVLALLAMLVPMQILLTYLIYISIRDIDEIIYYLNVFIKSAFFVNLYAVFLILKNETGFRLMATFNDANYLGRFEVFIISILLCYLLFFKFDTKKKILIYFGIFICFLILIMTFSRTSILSFGLISVYLMFYSRNKYIKYGTVFFIIFLLGFVLIYVGSLRNTEAIPGTSVLGVFIDYSNATRLALNVAAINMFIDYPIFGIGFKNFYNVYVNYSYIPLDIPNVVIVTVVHSWLFSTMAEQGLVGTVPLLWFFYKVMKDMLKSLKNVINNEYKFAGVALYSLLIIFIFNGFFNPEFFVELLFPVLFGLAGGFLKINKGVTIN